MISDGEKQHYVALMRLSALFRGVYQKIIAIFIAWIVFILFEEKVNL